MYQIWEDPEEYEGPLGVRHRVEYRKENLYIAIFPPKCEVFISSVLQDQDPLTKAALNAMSRMITLAWKSSTLDKVIDQLRKSSVVTNDLPGILSRLLAEDFD